MRLCSRWSLLAILLISVLSYNAYVHLRTDRWRSQAQTQQTVPWPSLTSRIQLSSQNSARSTGSHPSVYRYMLGLNFWEQLTMGLRNLFSMACIGTAWNMSVVQPFTYNSRLYGLPNFKPDDNMNSTRRAEDLSLLFNTKSLNAAIVHSDSLTLSSFKTFIEHASREVTVIHFVSSKEVHELSVLNKPVIGRTIQEGFKSDSVIDCRALLPDYVQLIMEHLNEEVGIRTESYSKFKVTKYLCVNMSVLITSQSLASKLDLSMSADKNETVIIVNWRGIATQSVLTNTAKGAHFNNRIAINSTCKDRKITAQQSTISYSPLVLKTTNLVLKDLKIANVNYTAVHIRGEKMGLREPRFPGSFGKCLRKLSLEISTLSRNNPTIPILYITDYGPYSSDTCKHCKSGERLVSWLKRRGDHQLVVDPIKYNLPPDSGLAAAIEANLLASAQYLLVCGGGAFQKQVASRFLNKHKHKVSNYGDALFRVCTEDGDLMKSV